MNHQPGDTVFDLAITRQADGGLVLLAARESGVFVSVDMAESWSGVWTKGMATAIKASRTLTSNGVIVAGVPGAIIQSEDAGASWAVRAIESSDSLISSLPIRSSATCSPLILAGSVEDGLYRSTDGGVSWHPSNCGA